jgi:hypothetical protein
LPTKATLPLTALLFEVIVTVAATHWGLWVF